MTTLETDHRQIVKRIIDEALDSKLAQGQEPKILDQYVRLKIGHRIHPIELFNAAIAAGEATNNGVENMRRGERRVFLNAMKELKYYFVKDREGFIRRRDRPINAHAELSHTEEATGTAEEVADA